MGTLVCGPVICARSAVTVRVVCAATEDNKKVEEAKIVRNAGKLRTMCKNLLAAGYVRNISATNLQIYFAIPIYYRTSDAAEYFRHIS